MSDLKNTGVYTSAKLPNIGADQSVFNRQTSDSIKIINNQIRILREQLAELEEAKQETFKYLKGSLASGRTAPNADGEIELKSGNNSIEIKADKSVVDLRVKNDLNEYSSDTTPGAVTGFVRVQVGNSGRFWIALHTTTTP